MYGTISTLPNYLLKNKPPLNLGTFRTVPVMEQARERFATVLFFFYARFILVNIKIFIRKQYNNGKRFKICRKFKQSVLW